MYVTRRALALAVALAALALAGPAAAHPSDAAAPYIEKPGVTRDFSAGTVAKFSANIYCGKWKGVAVFHVGKAGVGVFDKRTFICDSAKRTTVHFVLSVAELEKYGHGTYEYSLRVGRHNDKGEVTRYTDAFSHLFTYS
ncbi:MAG TPA: hypothetical protein VGF46_12585 [Gaiellales bacterium]|jgi:hypothetical protein